MFMFQKNVELERELEEELEREAPEYVMMSDVEEADDSEVQLYCECCKWLHKAMETVY